MLSRLEGTNLKVEVREEGVRQALSIQRGSKLEKRVVQQVCCLGSSHASLGGPGVFQALEGAKTPEEATEAWHTLFAGHVHQDSDPGEHAGLQQEKAVKDDKDGDFLKPVCEHSAPCTGVTSHSPRRRRRVGCERVSSKVGLQRTLSKLGGDVCRQS